MIYELNVSYVLTYIFRSDRWENYNKFKRKVKDWYLIRKMKNTKTIRLQFEICKKKKKKKPTD